MEKTIITGKSLEGDFYLRRLYGTTSTNRIRRRRWRFGRRRSPDQGTKNVNKTGKLQETSGNATEGSDKITQGNVQGQQEALAGETSASRTDPNAAFDRAAGNPSPQPAQAQTQAGDGARATTDANTDPNAPR
jgi:hypothetical protein